MAEGWQVEIPYDDTQQYIEKLPYPQKDKVLKLIRRLEEMGNQLRGPHSRSLDGGLFELKTLGTGPAHRVYYAFQPGQRIIVLYAAPKSTRRREQQHIDLARRRQSEIGRG